MNTEEPPLANFTIPNHEPERMTTKERAVACGVLLAAIAFFLVLVFVIGTQPIGYVKDTVIGSVNDPAD